MCDGEVVVGAALRVQRKTKKGSGRVGAEPVGQVCKVKHHGWIVLSRKATDETVFVILAVALALFFALCVCGARRGAYNGKKQKKGLPLKKLLFGAHVMGGDVYVCRHGFICLGGTRLYAERDNGHHRRAK